MGRVRKTLRFVFSVGGYDGLSPIAKDSERTALIREQNVLIREQNRILSGGGSAEPSSGSMEGRTCAACGKPMRASSVKFPPFVHVASGKLECPR
jgi:hypothetical protein